eukprot:6007587-Pyramimonas_sp.AAC.1
MRALYLCLRGSSSSLRVVLAHEPRQEHARQLVPSTETSVTDSSRDDELPHGIPRTLSSALSFAAL